MSSNGNKGKIEAKVDQYVLRLGVDHIKDLCALCDEKQEKLEGLLEFNDVVERCESIRKRQRLN